MEIVENTVKTHENSEKIPWKCRKTWWNSEKIPWTCRKCDGRQRKWEEKHGKMQGKMQENSEDCYFGGWRLQDDVIEIVENTVKMQEIWCYGEEMRGNIWENVGKQHQTEETGHVMVSDGRQRTREQEHGKMRDNSIKNTMKCKKCESKQRISKLILGKMHRRIVSNAMCYGYRRKCGETWENAGK